jgi:hypothetical protein
MVLGKLKRIGVVLWGILVLGSVQPDIGQPTEPWPVKQRLVGEHGKKSKNISGIACSTPDGFPRSCLVIDDNLQDAQFVKLKKGELVAGKTVRLIENSFRGEPLELDGEGVAFANGYYYVIGSHGHPCHKDQKVDPQKDGNEIRSRIVANSQIVRFRPIQGEGAEDLERTSRLREILASEPLLQLYVNKRLEKNGLTIEGVAVKDDVLYAGLRGPVLDDGRAVIVAARVHTLFEVPERRMTFIACG